MNMLTNAVLAFSLLIGALAAGIGPASPRDVDPSDTELLASCPGGPGASTLIRADRCTLINVVNNPDVRPWVAAGDPQLNCAGATDPITVTVGGSTTVTQSTTVSADVGFDIDDLELEGGLTVGASADAGVSTSNGKSVEVSTSTQYTVPPGRQAVRIVGIAQTSQTGNIQVNYGSRQDGHYIWYTGATVTQLTPKPDDIDYDVHETDCGTDPMSGL